MSRSTPRWTWSRLPGHALLATSIVLLIAAPAHAGVGDMLKKAKDKATKAMGQKATPQTPAEEGVVEFDDVILELTDARVGRIVAAFKAAREIGAGRPALVERLNKTNDERGALWEKQGEKVMEVRRKRSEIESCYHDGYQEAQDRKTAEVQQRALSDPALREKYMRAAQENNAAAAKGDSAAMARIMQVFREETMPSREDSLKVRQSCGPLPPISPAETRLDALDKEAEGLQGKIREIDDKVAEAQAKEGGLDRAQWAMALERIQMYLSQRRSNPPSIKSSRSFSQAEIEAMEKYLEELRKALG